MCESQMPRGLIDAYPHLGTCLWAALDRLVSARGKAPEAADTHYPLWATQVRAPCRARGHEHDQCEVMTSPRTVPSAGLSRAHQDYQEAEGCAPEGRGRRVDIA